MSKQTHDNKAIRNYIRDNRHYTDEMVADKFGVSNGVISANKAHITMGTDTDNPQKRAEPKFAKTYLKQLILIKTSVYHLIIDENGGYMRLDLKSRKVSKLTDEQAKAIMLNRLYETYN